jgi:hypothetical protein
MGMPHVSPPTVSRKFKAGRKAEMRSNLRAANSKAVSATNWTHSLKGAFLAAYRCDIGFAEEIQEQFRITSKMIGEWARNPAITAIRDSYFEPA